jgi:hypothetical protein
MEWLGAYGLRYQTGPHVLGEVASRGSDRRVQERELLRQRGEGGRFGSARPSRERRRLLTVEFSERRTDNAHHRGRRGSLPDCIVQEVAGQPFERQ